MSSQSKTEILVWIYLSSFFTNIWEYLYIHKIKKKLNDPTTEVYIVQNEFMLDVIRSELLKKSSGKKLPELFYLGGCTYKISFYFNPFGHYFV